MNAFLAWSGWAGISALAQLVALVTVIGAIWRFFRQRRLMGQFVLDWEIMGSLPMGERTYHVVQFHNIGRGTGVLHMLEFFGADIHHEDGYYAARVMAPGQSFRLLLTAPELSKVWFRSTVRTGDRTRVLMLWYALTEGALADERVALARKLGWRSKLQQAIQRKPVGPGAALRGVVHAGRRGEGQRLQGDYWSKGIYSQGTLHTAKAEDLPFYPGPWNRDLVADDAAQTD